MAAITTAELIWRYSTTAGAAGNTTAGTAAGSLGRYISTTAWAGGVANDLFDDLTGAANAASQVDYRCIFIYNSNAANAYQNAVAYISSEVAGGASIAIGPDPTAASALGSATAQAVTIANATTAPAGVTFTAPTTSATGIALGTIPATQVKAFWIRRTAANTAPLSGDGMTLALSGDTGSL
jgi:hypothetical protein